MPSTLKSTTSWQWKSRNSDSLRLSTRRRTVPGRANDPSLEERGLRDQLDTRQCGPSILVEEAVMSSVTREQVLEWIAGLGVPLENVFLIAEEHDAQGVIAAW